MKKEIRTLAALLIASAALVACSSSDDSITENQQPVNPTGKYTMTIKASKGSDAASTRALALDGKTLKATWNAGEEVLVYQNGSSIGTLTAAASTDASTTLSGTLTSAPDPSKDLTFYFHTADAASYSGQDGTLTTIASTYDFCAPATVTAGNFTVNTSDKTVTAANITFGANQQAIVKFTLLDKGNSDAAISATQLVVNDGANDYTITLAPPTSEIYVAIPGFSGQTVTLTATDGSDTYTYEKSGVTFTNGKYYEITVKMTKQAPAARALSEATTDDIGKIAGADGYIYDDAAAAGAAGTTASAMIAYVGSATQPTSSDINASMATYNHGLAIALTEVSNTSGAEGRAGMEWADAGTAAGAYTRARPSASSAWFLPSVYQWMWMLNGCGGGTPTTTLTDVVYSYGNFQTKMQNCGGTQMQSQGSYWSSTVRVENDYHVWRYTFYNGGRISYTGKGDNCMVRSAFAF